MHLTALVLVVALVAIGSAQQLIAPLLPTEFATNVIQHKWNFNGGLVNNTYSGMWYSSRINMMIRSDGVANAFENASVPFPTVTPMVQISLLDFSVDPPINTYLEHDTLNGPSPCYVGPVTGFFLPNATFLRDTGAVYAGRENLVSMGVVDKWSFMLPDSDTAVTFFFDMSGNYVRWDLWSYGYQTGVQTWHINLKEYPDGIPAAVFSGSGACPSGLKPRDHTAETLQRVMGLGFAF